jgi:hypothetical protein
MGPLQASCTGFAIVAAGSLVWGNKAMRIKKREIGGALSLGGCHFTMQYNNQPIVDVHSFDIDRAEAWPGRSIWGGTVALFWPLNEQRKNKQSKI